MPLNPPQAYRKTAFTHRRGTRANQPLATDVLDGTIYYVTDETVLERSNGATWQSYSAAVVSPYVPPTYTQGSVLFAGVGGVPTQDNANFFWNDSNNRLGIGTTSPSYTFDLLGSGVDIGYVARFKENGNAGSTWVQISSPTSGANGQAGFSLVQTPGGHEWRFAALGSNGENAWRVTGDGLDVLIGTLTGNIIINNAITDPTAGSKCLIFGDGTVPSGLDSNTAGLYANDVNGTVNMFAINEAGDSVQITGPSYTSTATGNIDDLDFNGARIIVMNNASLATIRGLKAGYEGQVVAIVAKNAQVDLSHQDTGDATAANRLINNVTVGYTSIVIGGSAVYVYDSVTTRWRLRIHNQGNWISSAFSAGEFTGSGAQTWTVASGDVTVDRYLVVGKALIWQFRYVTTTVGGTPDTQLIKTLPAGYNIGTGSDSIVFVSDNGTAVAGLCLNSSATQVAFQKIPNANWAASTDNTQVRGTAFIELT